MAGSLPFDDGDDGARAGPGVQALRAYDALPQAVMVTDPGLVQPGPRIVYVNPAFERMTGWPASAALGQTPRILQGPETDPAVLNEMKAALARGAGWMGETVNYRRDGAAFRMKWSVAPMRDADGEVTGYLSIQEDVTEPRAAARRQTQLHGVLDKLLAEVGEAIVIVDADGRVRRFGAGAESIFGWPAEEIVGRRVDVLIPERFRDRHGQYLAAFVQRTGRPCVMGRHREVVGLRRDGREFEAEASIGRLSWDDGPGAIAVVRDLSELRQRERALAESETRFRALFDLSYQFVGLLDADGHLLEANATALAFIDAGIDQVRGQRFPDTPWFRAAPAARARVADAVARARAGAFVQGTLELAARDGDLRTFDVSIRPVRDDQGAIRYLIPEGRDITETARSADALRRSEDRLKKAQSIARVGDWQLDVASGKVTWSDEVFRIFGYAPQSFQPSYEAFVACLHPDDRDRVTSAVAETLESGRPYRETYRLVRADGSLRDAFTQAEPETDAAGRVVALAGIVQDVTETRAVEAALSEAARHAQEASEAKSRFLSTMSHELRTPLNAINGFSEVIAEEVLGPVGTPKYRDYARDIRRSGAHLLDVIDSILEATQLESGQVELTDELFDAQGFLQAAADLVRPQAEQRRVELTLRSPASATLAGDRRLLRQALLNLLTNAIKFSPAGGGVDLRATAAADGGYRIEVRDHGPGIPEADLERVTLPFVQGDERLARSHEGSGLGLYIARSFAELHGGWLDLSAPPEGGTLAAVVLPPARVRRSRIGRVG